MNRGRHKKKPNKLLTKVTDFIKTSCNDCNPLITAYMNNVKRGTWCIHLNPINENTIKQYLSKLYFIYHFNKVEIGDKTVKIEIKLPLK